MTQRFDYNALVDTAMRGVVKSVLQKAEREGLDSPHHFFITFRTDFPGVSISDALRAKYPQDITIVLQHQYRDLRVGPDQFTVVLSFANIPEKLVVPYAALTAFADPGVKFGLQFHEAPEQMEQDELPSGALPETNDTAEETAPTGGDGSKVVTLDAFRKK